MAEAARELAADYYRNNFLSLLSWVEVRYECLLNVEEKQFIQNFYRLSHASQCLLVRLSSRKGLYFRHDKLRYPEISSVEQAALELTLLNYITTDPALELQEFAGLVTKPELLAVFAETLAGKKSGKKSALIDILMVQYDDARAWSSWSREKLGELYRLNIQEYIDLFILLFFGNTHQDLTEFVLQDIGLFTYEQFAIDRDHQIFSSRQELDEYQRLNAFSELEYSSESVEDLHNIAPLLPSRSLSLRNQNKLERLRNRIAYRLEQNGELESAFALYHQNSLAPARERRIRILEKTGKMEMAWALLNQAAEMPVNEHEAQVIERIRPRLSKKLGLEVCKIKHATISEIKVHLDQSYSELGVEEACRIFYETKPWINEGGKGFQSQAGQYQCLASDRPCFYLENQLFNALFGLWLWPEMFKSVDGAFANPFQMAPLDLYQQDFVAQRPGINALWKLFDNHKYKTHIITFWRKKYGIANHFVNWSYVSEELLEISLNIIPASHLKAIFKRLLFDIKANKSGFPDLIQFDLTQGLYKLIEVKGPNDRLQDNQIRWIQYFIAKKIPVEVCYVNWR